MYGLQGGRRFDIVKEPSARQCRCREVRKDKVTGEVLEAVAMSPGAPCMGKVSYFMLSFMENSWRDLSGVKT